MNRIITLAVCAVMVIGLTGGCKKRDSVRYLVVSEVTHFEIQGNGKILNLPVFAGTLSTDEITRDVSLADYYYQKLSAVYEFKSFTFINASSMETLLDQDGPLTAPQRVYEYEDSLSRIELLLTSFTREKAGYLFRISNRKSGQVRDHTVEVQSGQSASVGALYDEAHNRGRLVAISNYRLAVTRDLTPEQLTGFLQKKNTPRGGKTPDYFTAGDQRWMNELFGAKAAKLPVEPPVPSPNDSTAFIQFDMAPTPLSAMIPEYPESAKKNGIEGTVYVSAYIGKNGEVKAAKVVRSVQADLDSAAVRAVRATRFKPAMQKGNPVAVWVTIPFRFKLDN